MKIIFLSALYPPKTKGGGELSTHYIAQGLLERGHDVHVITGGEKSSQYEIEGVSVETLPVQASGKPLLERRYSRKVARYLKPVLEKYKADVIHAHDFRMALALAELKLPNTMVTARDYAQICGSTNNLSADGGLCPGCTWTNVWGNHRVAEASWPRKFFRAWQFAHNMEYRKAAFRTFNHQIFISHAQQQEILKQQDLGGVEQHVNYNPVPPTFLEAPVKPLESKEILYVGTVEWYKGGGLLLEAFQALAADFPDWTLKIVGDGADLKKYQKMASEWNLEKRITFTGRVAWDQLRDVYDQAAVVVAPHIWIEPFGRTVAEAMARGRVVVAANSGGPVEIIQDKKTGFLFQAKSTNALQRILQQVIALPDEQKKAVSSAAHRWVADNLSIDIIAAQYEQALLG